MTAPPTGPLRAARDKGSAVLDARRSVDPLQNGAARIAHGPHDLCADPRPRLKDRVVDFELAQSRPMIEETAMNGRRGIHGNRITRAMRGLRAVASSAAIAVVFGSFAAAPAQAQDDSPSGGGIGCKSNGNCQGTVYKDIGNLDRWWYPICSGCHTVLAPAPTTVGPLSASQLAFVRDYRAFWKLHGQAVTDPVLVRLLPKSQLKPVDALAPEFKALLRNR